MRDSPISSRRLSGMPMSTTSISPTIPAPGYCTSPTLGAAKVTVRSAITAWSAIAPVAPDTPLGMSTDRTCLPESLMAPIAAAWSPATAPDRPVPNKASISRSKCESSRSSSSAPAGSGEHVPRLARHRLSRALHQLEAWDLLHLDRRAVDTRHLFRQQYPQRIAPSSAPEDSP